MSAQATETEAPSFPAVRPRVDLTLMQCRELLGLPEWEASSWRAVEPDSLMLEGGVYERRITRGPRKGSPDWKSAVPRTKRTIVLSRAMREDFARKWEEATGFCSECGGDGRRMRSWHYLTGMHYDACLICGGSGNAKAVG